ncbi:MAG: PHP domain-containing protein [Chloroflexi bacterium]|nr:PHP domain-containing protein [Chloroflexota bacterium]
MAKVDLHVHSTASDGRLSPEDVVRMAAQRGLAVIAIADHDSVNGIVPALATATTFPQLKVIPAVEISTDVPHGEVHILGYFIDYTSHQLKATLERMRHSRELRAQKMIAKLARLGMPIEWQRVQQIAGSGSIGRPHIAQAMLEKGYIASVREAFDRYISRDGPAYAEREKMAPAEAVELVLQANGLPVLAHPPTVSDPEAIIIQLKAAGLVGIEAYYNGYSPEQVNEMVSLADKYGLIATGGSDYHGLDDSETMIGGIEVPMEAAQRLIALARERGVKLAAL